VSAPLRLATFALVLLVVFVAAWRLGALVEPGVDASPSHGGM
jgi:hypothetical protein